MGTKVVDRLVKELGSEATTWVKLFKTEGDELSAKYPPGSHPIEKIDIEKWRAEVKVE